MPESISEKNSQVPKVIHYCWFGGNPLSELAINCIKSWRKFCPDYEIKEWNESNFDVKSCTYVEEAYNAKKWAFVSDYARFWILYHEGGLYFDTDVEIIKSLEELIDKGPFMGCELALSNTNHYSTLTTIHGDEIGVNPGLGLCAYPNMKLYKIILDFYEHKHFINKDGSNDLTTVVQYTTSILLKDGFCAVDDIQYVDGVYIYPKDYFCPINYITGEINITDNTKSIHHYNSSWKTKKEQKQSITLQKLNRKFGKRWGFLFGRIYTLPYRVMEKYKYKGFWGTIKFAIAKLNHK